MATTAADGIWGFAPALNKTDLPATPKWYRHKASLVDLGVMDDQRTGPLEVGGGPFPTFPYKAGYTVGGGATVQPRLEGTLGWLLHAAVGSVKTSLPVPGTAVHTEITCTGSYPQEVTTGITAPPATGAAIALVIGAPAGASMTATIHIDGTDMSDQALVADYAVVAAAAGAIIKSTAAAVFKTVTGITITAGAQAGDHFTPKYSNGMAHTFVPYTSSPSRVRWIQARKYIPLNGDADADSDLGETYVGVKPLSIVLTLPNNAPITCRFDMLGRDFSLADDISGWTWENEFEDWESIPVGCETGGYIKFTGGGLTGEELPVVAAQVGWVNTPLDLRQERVYGSPMLEDITVVSRAMTYDCTVKWNNPDLYRAIIAGAIAGTSWTSRPLVGSMEALMVAPGLITADQKYSLAVTSPEILWQMNGTPQLAAGQAIIMRFTGTALLPSTGDYTSLVLTNDQDNYDWPTS